jgi:hypothetical protein
VAKLTIYLKHVPPVGHTVIWAATEQKAQVASITENSCWAHTENIFRAFLGC